MPASIGESAYNLDFEEFAEKGFGFSAALDYTELRFKNGLFSFGLLMKGFNGYGFGSSFSYYLVYSVLES